MASCLYNSPVWCQNFFLLSCRCLGMVCQWWEAVAVCVRRQMTGWVDRVPLSSLVIDFCLFFFFFKVHIDFKFWGESTPRNDGELLNLGDALDIHREVSLMDQGHPASLHASQAWISLWSASVPQDVYFATPFPVWKMDSIILPYPVGSRRLITEGGKVLWCHKKD